MKRGRHELRCPACNYTILSRRNKLCSFCQEPLPADLLFTPAEIELQEAQRALQAKVQPSSEVSGERGSPSGLKPTLRQMMILVVWAALLTAAARQALQWHLLGSDPGYVCITVPVFLGFYPMPILAGLLWLLDRPGRVRRWYCSTCMIAAHFLGGIVFSLQDSVCYLLTSHTTMFFPMGPFLAVIGFWCGWMQWQTACPRPCPTCGRRSVIPDAHLLNFRLQRKYNTGKHGWCATCGSEFEREGLEVWSLVETD